MRWLKGDMWKAGIAVVSMLLLMVLLIGIPMPAAGASEGAPGLATSITATVQVTPTVDATVTALNKEKLAQDVSQQQRTWTNWLWGSAAAISSTFVIVIGALIGLGQWRRNQRMEREKRAEERFQSIVTGLGDDKEGARIGAAILLRIFLRRGYEQFYTQIFDLVVANLRLPRTSYSPEDPDAPLPLTILSQTLMVAFKEAFPRARSQHNRDPQSLDASSIQLDNAYLREADLKQIWMPQASLRNVDLVGADLREAELAEVNLRRSDLREADLSGANLREANLGWSKLAKADLFTTNLREANLRRGDLREANLREANLRRGDLREADLSGAKLVGTDLRGADLSRANLSGANLIKANLREANLSGANLSGANLSGANLSGANLFMTDLSGASLIEADLSGAKLSRADLSGAKLNWADLSGANLSRVIGLTEKQLETYKAQGASIVGAPTTTSSQSAVSTSPAPQSNSTQAPPVQGDISTADTGESSVTSSEQDRES